METKLLKQFIAIRQTTLDICKNLIHEDYVVQPIDDVSPPKWHLAHTTWFYETFLLKPYKKDYKIFHPDFNYIFNSYYETVGERVARASRGNLSRPGIDEIKAYRKYIDEAMYVFLDQEDHFSEEIKELILIGLNHEQQHQELLVTDIKYILGNNPLLPVYSQNLPLLPEIAQENEFINIPEGIYEIGHKGFSFAFDNETPHHKVFLQKYKIANRLITNREYLEFMEADGYKKFIHWLSDGWYFIHENNIKSPLYWHFVDGSWHYFTLNGLRKLDLDAPVSHVSYYEAEAYASYRGMRLPTEAEWEVATTLQGKDEVAVLNFLESELMMPIPATKENNQFFGDAWEWTASAYLPYPGYRKPEGAIGEYNGKFMINQMVLRGGSCATPASHIRNTYRNFFQPDKRWQFTGIRLASNE